MHSGGARSASHASQPTPSPLPSLQVADGLHAPYPALRPAEAGRCTAGTAAVSILSRWRRTMTPTSMPLATASGFCDRCSRLAA